VIGVLEVFNQPDETSFAFSELDEMFLQAYASLASMIVEYCRDFGKTVEFSNKAVNMTDFNNTILLERTPQATIDIASNIAQRVSFASDVKIFKFNQDRQTFQRCDTGDMGASACAAEASIQEANHQLAVEKATGKSKTKVVRPTEEEIQYAQALEHRPVEEHGNTEGILAMVAAGEVSQITKNANIKVYNIPDAYLHAEFDASYEQKMGVRTKGMLVVPIPLPYHKGTRPKHDKLHKKEPLLGCIQLLNKVGGQRFSETDEEMVSALAAQLSTVLYIHHLAEDRDALLTRYQLLMQSIQHVTVLPDLEKKQLRLRDFFRTTPEWWTTMAPMTLLEAGLKYLTALTGSRYASMYVVDAEAGDFVGCDCKVPEQGVLTFSEWIEVAIHKMEMGRFYRAERGNGLVSAGNSKAFTIQNVHDESREDEETTFTIGLYQPEVDDRSDFETGRVMVMPLRSRIGIKAGVIVVRRGPDLPRYTKLDEDTLSVVANAVGNAVRLSLIGERDPSMTRQAQEQWAQIFSTSHDVSPGLYRHGT